MPYNNPSKYRGKRKRPFAKKGADVRGKRTAYYTVSRGGLRL